MNLNTAPPEILALLPGVGPAKAQSILAYRKRHPFRTVDELVRIKGIGRKMVRRLRRPPRRGRPDDRDVALDAAPRRRLPPPPPPPKRPLAPPLCVHAAVHPARAAARPAMPTHGACPRPP